MPRISLGYPRFQSRSERAARGIEVAPTETWGIETVLSVLT
jgi:hypothetical protein